MCVAFLFFYLPNDKADFFNPGLIITTNFIYNIIYVIKNQENQYRLNNMGLNFIF